VGKGRRLASKVIAVKSEKQRLRHGISPKCARMLHRTIVLARVEVDMLGCGVEVQGTIVMAWVCLECESLVVKYHLYFDLIWKGGVAVA
jgi:hypothetical protein